MFFKADIFQIIAAVCIFAESIKSAESRGTFTLSMLFHVFKAAPEIFQVFEKKKFPFSLLFSANYNLLF